MLRKRSLGYYIMYSFWLDTSLSIKRDKRIELLCKSELLAEISETLIVESASSSIVNNRHVTSKCHQ